MLMSVETTGDTNCLVLLALRLVGLRALPSRQELLKRKALA
jgi:hypothetical protein